MPRNWQKLDGGPIFKGTLQRRQQQVEDLGYWAELRNVDGYGGTLGKRPGTQIVNGYGTLTVVGSTTTVLQVEAGAQFTPAHVVAVSGIGVSSITAVTATTITVSPPLPSAPAAGVSVLQILNAGVPDTLFQAIYRDQNKHLFAAIAGTVWTVQKALAPQATIQNLPQHLTDTASAAGQNIVKLIHPSGVTVADWLYFPNISTTSYQVKVVFGSYLVLDRNLEVPVPASSMVILHPPHGIASSLPQPEMVQYGNRTHMTGGKMQGGTPAGMPLAPIVVEQQSPAGGFPVRMRRHGVKPPFWFNSGGTPPVAIVPVSEPDSRMVPNAQYEYRYRFLNSRTGQESEGSLPAVVTTGTAPLNATEITMTGSPDPQVDQIRIYRTTANGGGAWYRLLKVRKYSLTEPPGIISQIPSPPISTGPDSVVVVHDISGDDELGAQMRDLMDFCIPDTVCALGIWGQANRLIGIDQVTNTVVYSDQPDLQTGVFKDEAWPLNNQIFVSYDDGDVLTGIATFMDAVLIFKEHSVWRVTGIPPDIQIQAVQFRQDQTAAGAMSQRSIVVDHDEVIFRGTDAIYELNRYEGQGEGFQSKRVSLPIDDVLMDEINAGKETTVIPHAVFYRYKRQLRVWITSQRCLVLQYDATVEGEPTGWTEWELSEDSTTAFGVGPNTTRCSCIARFDPTLFRGNVDTAMLVSPLDAGVFIGMGNGAILQMDIGQADYGVFPYEVHLRTLRFPPAGRGSGARIRALDWQVSSVNAAVPELRFWSDMLLTKTRVTMQVPRPLDIFPSPQPPDTIDIIKAQENPFLTFSALVVVPGQYHTFEWFEKDPRSMYRILGWALWFQALPEAVVRRHTLQTPPETVINEIDPVVQG